ncbi:alkylmercury lyase family protein [Rhizosaccharibacter radicis]|uniref:Alkylmercury lyase family protein n=1 Tax=Rhizosaccharibacter radicis TaxID=2782605 RepID=A0ABT1W0W5_9PROT|nr:alkylmercury lyase family protein [Acetobacteraceae bacterium KSS12]
MSSVDQDTVARVHHAFIRPMLDTGRMPTRAAVASETGTSLEVLDDALAALAGIHGVVLDPHDGEPWVMHPFSAAPTATWVEHGDQGWWAPCPWCAFGIAGLKNGHATIHTRLGGEREPVVVHVQDGRVLEDDLVVHFAVPPRDAWNNVHRFCASVLLFRNRNAVSAWCVRHGIAEGGTMPVQQAWELGRDWYARHADPDWRKWSAVQAAGIFNHVGLTTPFWHIPAADQPF